MKTICQIIICAGALFLQFLCGGCKKEDSFLNSKPNQALTEPTTLADIALLLKNETIFNRNYPGLGEVGTDDMVLDQSTWQNEIPLERNVFTWAKDVYPPGQSVNDWNYPYQLIFYANTALDQLEKIGSSDDPILYDQLKGAALFYRAVAYYNLLELFSPPYDAGTASTQPGVPLILTANLNAKAGRAPQSVCYQQLIADLTVASGLLPNVAQSKTDASRSAALAMLSRIYLVMADFDKAQATAIAALELYKQLSDFTKLPVVRPVFPNFSVEELFHASMLNYTSFGANSQVNPDLYALFNDPNDLRLAVFFRTVAGKITWNSQADRKNFVTYALTTAELYLTKAECEARAGNTDAALVDLNTLLVTRWKAGTFKPFTATGQDEALQLILQERRKELAMTGIRWTDLRRLNKQSRYAVTLMRTIGAQVYSLPPNDPRYALPVPENEILVNPMPQNER